MRRAAACLLLLAAGCSTAPLADLMDFFWPGRIREGGAAPYGGVCQPRPVVPGAVPVGAPVPGVPAPVTPPPAPAPVGPPPAPAPGPVPFPG